MDPAWSDEWLRRTLTDEPGPGMGAPFGDADVQMFLRACGRRIVRPGEPPLDHERLQRMWEWIEGQRS